jgi:ABC-type uncharacterized transport system auxiliary subunit
MKYLHMSHWNGFSKGIILCLFMALGCLFLSGCFGSKAPERTYFSIDYTLGTQPKYNAPKFNKSVVIQNVTSALAYDRQEIVYRANPYEFQYYWYRLWAAKPRKMLPELISGHLRYTNIFKTVSTTIEDRLPDYILDIEINAIEELDVSETEWYAHLALRFTLQRTEDSANVWTYSFDVRRPVADNKPVYVVKAISELLDSELVKTFDNLDKSLSARLSSSHSQSQDDSEPDSADSSPALDFDASSAESENNPSEDDSRDMPRATLKNKPKAPER